ncbi:Hypothetical predicted protein [Cloeon dipterum]|uniref:carbonyl reductase (NADPH) n=1 Tax=Cloeon dipterum TaxID=197152 RepID=A0A8S1C5M4_9INSE|nr:Hypothetical predicted protein [Cloeon dipterum]
MAAVKVAVVTGGNKGIGYAITQGLCDRYNGTVYLTARDENRGREAVAKLNKLGYKPLFHQLDIEDQGSINRFKRFIEETHGGLDVLVNNAAIAYKNDSTDPFGKQAEDTIRINFFGVLNTCRALLPLMRSHGRVVNVSSSCGHLLRINGQEPQAAELRTKLSSPSLTEEELCDIMRSFVKAANAGNHYELGYPNSCYVVSKVGVSALSQIQQRTFDNDTSRVDMVVNHVHPGYVDTDMTSHKGPLTIEEGAVGPLYCALLPPDVKEPRGQFIWKDCSIVDWVNGPTPSSV